MLAQRGDRVLALDSDTLPGLALTLGVSVDDEAPLLEAAERDERGRWRLKRGIGPVRAVRRFATEGPDGVRFLQSGKTTPEGTAPIQGSVNAFYAVIHALPRAKAFSDWSIVGDLPAGPRQMAYDWAPYADELLLLAEPTWQSALTARRIARIARSQRRVDVLLVASKVSGRSDSARVAELVREPLFAALPADESVATAERSGAPLIDYDPDAATVNAVRSLAAALDARRLGFES